MIKNEIEQEYFEWMYELVCDRRFSKQNSYSKLLSYLHQVEFTWVIKKDANRAEDGLNLRRRFSLEHDLDDLSDLLDGPCSVLEMMIALSIRCEEDIMDDPSFGNRTSQWFWRMVVNIGLGEMTDQLFNANKVDRIIIKFLNREYEPNGKGGLFVVKNSEYDMRDVEIWYQLCYYLDSIV